MSLSMNFKETPLIIYWTVRHLFLLIFVANKPASKRHCQQFSWSECSLWLNSISWRLKRCIRKQDSLVLQNYSHHGYACAGALHAFPLESRLEIPGDLNANIGKKRDLSLKVPTVSRHIFSWRSPTRCMLNSNVQLRRCCANEKRRINIWILPNFPLKTFILN